MATTLYLRSTETTECRGYKDPNLDTGQLNGWNAYLLSETVGTGTGIQASRGTRNGPTGGMEVPAITEWLSMPFAADTTISGTVSFDICAHESSMSANVTIAVIVERLDKNMAIVSTIVQSAWGTELGTANARRSWTAAPTSTTVLKGERIRIRVYGDDAGTMATGYFFYMQYDGSLANLADSRVAFTETLTFMSVPSGTTVLHLSDRPGGPQYVSAASDWGFGSGEAADDDQFGHSCDIADDGQVVAVGAHYAEDVNSQEGLVYVFNGAYLATNTKKSASDKAASDFFGTHVRLSKDGSILAVSAAYEDGSSSNEGKIYVYTGASWGTETIITSATRQNGAYMGEAMDMSEDGSVIVAGAWGYDDPTLGEGRAYIFKGASWATEVLLAPVDRDISHWFGTGVAVSGDGRVIAVSSPGFDGAGTNIGKVYLFDNAGNQLGSVTGPDGNSLSFGGNQGSNPYGRPLALNYDGSILCVSEFAYNSSAGCVWVYSGPNWSTSKRLTASDAAANDLFGYCVDISSDGRKIVVSAPINDQGAVYIFTGPNWANEYKMTPTISEVAQAWGEYLAISPDGNHMAVGVPNYNAGGTNRGYVDVVHIGSRLLTCAPGPLPENSGREFWNAGNQSYEYYGEWLTDCLQATTLTGMILVELRGKASVANRVFGAELAVVDADGGNPTVYGKAGHRTMLTTSYANYAFYIAGPDVTVARGRRLRLRVYAQDGPGVTLRNSGQAGFQFDGSVATPYGRVATDVTLRRLVSDDAVMANKGPGTRMSIISSNFW